MDNVQQLTSLFNVNRLLGKKNNNRGMLLSLLSIGIGTLVIWIIRGNGNKPGASTMQTMTSRKQMKNGLSKQ
ncbi:hypothetical protein [Priestia megaterium]|uniref:hypothetical protein n=1 Tax=Priestia megaterium TaxID=1404 RepID=UPI0006ABA404|nr:hypothetical protein [Priestia megaterium]KOP77384.1 hypothetical protein AMS61_24955 [Bacillus sp. FJAT-21351]QDZ84627.1 hypothetical protein D0441_09345 [Priestia megaterium]USL27445.1 hypothetical protein LIT33_27940 [Priestia megaterium]USL33512.1 hypothetical protein LIT30_27545 [Priestia megaterium]USL39329.1 hypothetical protein LIT34_29300 [Priestia megaterium]